MFWSLYINFPLWLFFVVVVFQKFFTKKMIPYVKNHNLHFSQMIPYIKSYFTFSFPMFSLISFSCWSALNVNGNNSKQSFLVPNVSINDWDFTINHDDAFGLIKIHFTLYKNIYSFFYWVFLFRIVVELYYMPS